MLRMFRPWMPLLVSATAVAVVASAHIPQWCSPRRSGSVEMCGPALDGPRLAAKARVAEDVVAGRLTLLEAAAAFKEMDADGSPYRAEAGVHSPPGVSLDEGYCRMVIAWARSFAPPDKAGDLTRRLEAELGVLLREGKLGAADHELIETWERREPTSGRGRLK